MKVKNLAYSVEKLDGFLNDMQNVEKTGDYTYCYKNAVIAVEPLNEKKPSPFSFKRSLMKLSGNESDIEEFYYNFLINHMTVGG